MTFKKKELPPIIFIWTSIFVTDVGNNNTNISNTGSCLQRTAVYTEQCCSGVLRVLSFEGESNGDNLNLTVKELSVFGDSKAA